jgi:predicted transcriptional regulator
VRLLEKAGFLSHEKKGKGYVYYPIISIEEYSMTFIGELVSQCLEGSYINAVSALLKDDKISIDALKELINRIEQEG